MLFSLLSVALGIPKTFLSFSPFFLAFVPLSPHTPSPGSLRSHFSSSLASLSPTFLFPFFPSLSSNHPCHFHFLFLHTDVSRPLLIQPFYFWICFLRDAPFTPSPPFPIHSTSAFLPLALPPLFIFNPLDTPPSFPD